MHEDLYRAPLNLAVTEDATDAVALQVAEPNAGDVNEEGEESAPVCVEFSERNLAEYEIRPLPPMQVEDLPALADQLRDSKQVQAFKSAFREVVSVRCNSKVRALTYGTADGPSDKPSCKPTPLELCCDTLLAGKAVLSVANYRLLCQHCDECFMLWDRVPARVRRFIEQRVGQSLIDRRIVVRNSTRYYFRDDYFLRRCAKTA